jgi:outer membrane protein assembly factor BamB
MEKQDPPGSHRKASCVRPWSIVAALLVVSFVIGSWVVVSQMARQQPSLAGRRAAVPHETPQDVYTAYKDVVYKLSGRDGSVIWKFALKQAYKPDRIIGSYLQLNVVNDVVYVAIEYGIYALRGSSGKEIWHYSPHLTPTEVAQDRGRIGEMFIDKSLMYLQLTRGDMAALDLRDGSPQWSHLSFPNGGSFSPSDDTLYASEFSGKGAPMLHAIDGRTGKERWHFERQLINTSLSPTFIFDGIVYSSGNPLYALDARTGKQLWEQRLPDGPVYFSDLQLRNGPCSPQIEASESHLYVLTRKRPYTLQVFDAHTGKALGQHPIAIPVKEDLNLSALSNDVLYVRSSVHEGDPYSSGSSTSFTHYFIYTIRLANGATYWKYDIGSLLDVQVPITELLLAP